MFHVFLFASLGVGLSALAWEIVSGIRFARRLQARETEWIYRNEYPSLD